MNNYEWQPIETAPKDHTKIMIYDTIRDNYLFCYGHNLESIIKNSPSYNWTVWITLPTPPKN